LTTWHNIYQKPPASQKKKTVTMTLPAKGMALNVFRGEVLDDASLLIVFLPAVQSDGSMFHSQ
jgi:hypothetical protein